MGTNSSRNNKYLKKQEIENVLSKKESLKLLFDKMKNADGYFTIFELRQLTYGLIEEFILKKIIKVCGTRERRMSYWDFLYFYALLNTTSSYAKLNFVLDFIFYTKDVLPTEKYISKTKKYFYNGGTLLRLLLDEGIIKNQASSNKIKREFVYNFITNNHAEEIQNYDLFRDTNTNAENTIVTYSNNHLISETSNHLNKKGKPKEDSENENVLIIKANVDNDKNNDDFSLLSSKGEESKSLIENDKKSKKEVKIKENPQKNKFDNLKASFQKMTKENGVLPISQFEDMLKEINVIQSLIDVIGNFLRQKSQKSFIGFELLKEVLSLITIPNINTDIISTVTVNNNNNNNDDVTCDINNNNEDKNKEEIVDGLFTLFAYPNDYINKKSFFIFAKSTKPELSSGTINEWFDELKITKYINKKKFREIIEYILDELIESFEHINYLPYIFFKAELKNKRMEKNCIEVLLKKKNLNDYIQERLQYDNVFYIVDKEFWDKWYRLITINSNDPEENRLNNNLSINMMKGVNTSNSIPNIIDESNNNKNNSKINYSNANTSTVGAVKKNFELKNLKMNTEKIADRDGKLKEGLVYLKDYIVLSERMYDLFKRWYGSTKNIEIKRNKIYLDDDNDNKGIELNNEKFSNTPDRLGDTKMDNSKSNLFNNNNESSNKISISKIHLNRIDTTSLTCQSGQKKFKTPSKFLIKNYSFLKGKNNKTNQRFEIEIYPVFLLFFNFSEVQKKSCQTLNQIVENIKVVMTKDNVKYYQFSRKTKFIELLHTLQSSLKIPLTRKNARLWLYYHERFEIMEYDDSLEKCGIINNAVIVLEIFDHNYWPSEKLMKDSSKTKEKNLNLVGLMNIGNTCYMNSILQIFLNNPEIKEIFLNESRTKEEEMKFYEFIINKKKSKGELIIELINLLKEKYIKNKKTIAPKKFKEICGDYNETFRGFDQQDAHDFYTFLVNNLHEDTNIKSSSSNKHSKEESDTVDTTDIELSNEYWANTIRNNASYIYGLFFGQLKSTLICSECNKKKLKYENFSALELPIPEGGKITLEIILFRLPCTLSPFYKMDTNTKTSKEKDKDDIVRYSRKNYMSGKTDLNKETKNENEENLRIKLKKLKTESIGKYAIPSVNSPTNSEKDVLNINIQNNNKTNLIENKGQLKYNETNLNTAFYENFNNISKRNKKIERNKLINEETTTAFKDELISNALNLNIPIRLRIEVDRKKKCGHIIETLKSMRELELDTESKFTEFVMMSKNKYIKEDILIDETFLSLEEVYIYELLNYEGIKKIFGYEDISQYKALELNKQDVQNMLDIVEEEIESNNNLTFMSLRESESSSSVLSSQNNTVKKIEEIPNEYDTNEILIRIIHVYKSLSNEKDEFDMNRIFNLNSYDSINTFRDFIILTTKNCIKPVNLYEMIWEKYMYFLDSPTKYESVLWWQKFTSSSSNDGVMRVNTHKSNTNNFNVSSLDCNSIPFAIKIIKKSTKSCYFCPWYRFCSGCPLNPAKQEYISISGDILILIDWKRDIIKKDMRESNIFFCLNHSSSIQSFDNGENEDDKKSIYDCLDLFTHEEIVKNIFCEKCNKKMNFKKRLEIDKFPKYLTLILKRFKYTSMFTTKIDNLITFPIENLDLTKYITQKEGKITYDLFGVVNHVGGLTGGHYHCDIKQEDTWIKYDDSFTCEYDKNIETANAYLLVYKFSEKGNMYHDLMRQEYKLNLIGLMDTAYKIYLKQYNFEHLFNYIYDSTSNSESSEITEEFLNDCEFYYGEPITVNGKVGYLINICRKDDNEKVYIKIKLDKGYYETNINRQKVIKETVKVYNPETTDGTFIKQINDDNSRIFCGSCIIF